MVAFFEWWHILMVRDPAIGDSSRVGVGEWYFLEVDQWVCASGWGRIFTTGLTIMGLHFYKSY